MARTRRALVLASAAVAAWMALPAHGLSCVTGPLREGRDIIHALWTESAVVFLGTLRSLGPSAEGRVVEDGPWFCDNFVATFESEASFKGEAAARIEVRVPRDLHVGDRYLVFAHEAAGILRTNRRCGKEPNRPIGADEPSVKGILAVLRGLPPAGAGGQMHVQVYPWRPGIEGTPIFLEHEDGTRLVALDANGTARASELRAGEYRITMPRVRGAIRCRWSADCGPIQVQDRGLVVAVIHVLEPSRVSLSSRSHEDE